MKSSFDVLAATIFAVVAVLHLFRIVLGWEVQIGTFVVPVWISWGGLIVAGALAIWGYTSARAPQGR